MNNRILEVAKKILSCNLNVTEGESVLIVSDDIEISEALAHETKELQGEPSIFYMPNSIRPMKEITEPLKSALKSSDVVLTPLERLEEETEFRFSIIKFAKDLGKARIAHMPGVTREVFLSGVLEADPYKMEETGIKIAEILTKGRNLRVTTSKGTDLSMRIGGWDRTADADVGLIVLPSQLDNLPAGESFISPLEGSTNGRLVVDGSCPELLLRDNEIIDLEIRDGFVTSIAGKESAKKYSKSLKRIKEECKDEEQRRNIYAVAELGIGLNENARLTGSPTIDEKVLGTAHIALGNNRFIGGKIEAPNHHDLVFLNPTIYVDDVKIIEDGKLLLDLIDRMCYENYMKIEKIRFNVDMGVKRSDVPGIVSFSEERLYRWWVSPTGNGYTLRIGDVETSRVSKIVWEYLSRKEYRKITEIHKNVKEEIEKVTEKECTVETILRILQVMDVYQLLNWK